MSRIGRIRSIKPEFFSSPSTAAASPMARLLYIAMWNFADDAGHAEWNVSTLSGFAFPNDDLTSSTFLALLREVQSAYDVTFYRVRGRRYYEVPNWPLHQRAGGRKTFLHPAPEDPRAEPDQEFLPTDEQRPSVVRTPSVQVPETDVPEQGEQGEQGNKGNKRRSPKRSARSPEEDQDFMEFWEAYGYKIDRHYAYECWSKVEGAEPAAIIDGARRYVAWLAALKDPPQQKNPSTFLNRRGWESEFTPPRGTRSETARPMANFN